MPLFRNNHDPPATQRFLAEETVEVERKAFTATLWENPLGRFVRLTENVNGHLNHIVIPASGLPDVTAMLARLALHSASPTSPPEPRPPKT